MIKKLTLLPAVFLLSGCLATVQDFIAPKTPEAWTAHHNKILETVEVQNLREWWMAFNDPALATLVELTLNDSPDRRIAEARILEARGLRRSARSSFFPQIGSSGNINRQDFGFVGPDNFFEATFDATYEIDVFGRVRNSYKASDEKVKALEAQYHDVTLTLVADVARSYIEYRANQKQALIAQKNLNLQKETLELIRQRKQFGEAPQLDVERAENLVNTTRASIPEFQRLATNSRLQLSVLTGHLPDALAPVLQDASDISGFSVEPVLLTPADVLSIRPDVRAAQANLKAYTALSDAAFAGLFPSFTLSGLFGYSEGAFSGTANIWNIVLGTAVTLIDFGRIEGAIDTARAREVQAFETYRRTVLEAVTEVETALNDIGYINEQRASLQKAYDNANAALILSKTLYKEGEISFLDVLDAQRTVNDADSALISSEAAQAESLIRLYKALGVY